MPETFNTLWIGGDLGRVERACLRSVVRQGHRLRLWYYAPLSGIPDGVEIADAREILPADRIVCYHNGSFALFSNYFRYALQRAGAGLWLDADVYCLRPLEFDDPYLFGWQLDHAVGTAVLRLPPDAPFLPLLMETFEGKIIPPWATEKQRKRAQNLLARNGDISLAMMGWGFTGPKALTHCVLAHNLEHCAKPPSVFYPTSSADVGWTRDPTASVDRVIAADTVAVHLWNEKIKAFKNEPAPAGSFLAQLQAEGA
jgi:hypothetical protein